jgi:hypothetical protein
MGMGVYWGWMDQTRECDDSEKNLQRIKTRTIDGAGSFYISGVQ